jgi:hypothetical protein
MSIDSATTITSIPLPRQLAVDSPRTWALVHRDTRVLGHDRRRSEQHGTEPAQSACRWLSRLNVSRNRQVQRTGSPEGALCTLPSRQAPAAEISPLLFSRAADDVRLVERYKADDRCPRRRAGHDQRRLSQNLPRSFLRRASRAAPAGTWIGRDMGTLHDFSMHKDGRARRRTSSASYRTFRYDRIAARPWGKPIRVCGGARVSARWGNSTMATDHATVTWVHHVRIDRQTASRVAYHGRRAHHPVAPQRRRAIATDAHGGSRE